MRRRSGTDSALNAELRGVARHVARAVGDEHAVVVRWHVAKGDRVRAGQPLVTLETTKTTFDVDSPSDGYAFFEHEPNAELAVGATVAWIADNDGPLQIATPVSRAAVPPTTESW